MRSRLESVRPPAARPSSAAAPSASVRRQVEGLLPPQRRGMHALGELAQLLKRLEAEGVATPQDAEACLLESYFGSVDVLVNLARGAARGLSVDAAQDVVQRVGIRLHKVYETWKGQGRFEQYLSKTITHEALLVLRGEERVVPLWAEPSTRAADDADEREKPSTELQALRRFTWYLYGSPDNPKRFAHDKAFIDFLAFAARLEARPFQELVRANQPRPGEWGPGEGERDNKWWRGRAQQGQQAVQDALGRREYKKAYERILAALGGAR